VAEGRYPSADYPAIAEIFEWAQEAETGESRFLRNPQLRALETYWYLRLVEDTPQAFALYRKLFPGHSDLLEALGLDDRRIERFALDHGPEALWHRIRTDDVFVREFRLESVRETLTLDGTLGKKLVKVVPFSHP
jgi:type III restriction enzyme